MAELASRPPSLAWADLSFTIATRDRAWGWGPRQEKQLLKGVSGMVAARSLTAIMGPSGSGKTTLLDVLSGAHYGGHVSGSVEVNGTSIDEWRASGGRASYVMQLDVLPHLDTPREALTTAALLRLPPSMSREKKLARVEDLLSVLDLEACADLMIGDATIGIRGLSGGQRRRVTIGIELIKNPSLILLDEPLSGLDSEMGEAVVQSLARLTKQGRTVMLSVHSASGTMMRAFTSTILMAGGRMVFNGPTSAAAPHLQSLGHAPLEGQSTAEFLLFVLKDPEDAEAAADAWAAASGKAQTLEAAQDVEGQQAASPRDGWALGIPASASRPELLLSHTTTTLADVPADLSSRSRPGMRDRQAGVIQQLRVLTPRFLRWRYRNRYQTLAQLALGFFSGILLGLVFWRLSSSLVMGTLSRNTALWMAVSIPSVFIANSAIVEWLAVRPLIRREHATGLYSAPVIWLTRSLDTLVLLVLSFMLYSVQYALQRLRMDASNYFIWLAAIIMTTVGSFFLGFAVVLVSGNGPTALALQSAISLVLISSSGFLNPDPPPYLLWLQQANYQTYSYSALCVNEYVGLVLQTQNGPVTLPEVPPYAAAVHADWGIGPLMGMLAGIVCALGFGCFAIFCLMARLKRL